MGAHGDKAAILYDQRRYDLAAEAFRRELAENPGDAWALAFLALSLTLSGRAKDGVPEAGRAVEAEPGSALAHYALSFAQLYAGNAGAALRSVHESLRINPDDADVLAHAATIHDTFEQWDWMLRASDAGLAVNPTHVGCLTLRARALAQLGRTAEADAVAHAALRQEPDDAGAHATRGWTLLHRGETEAAAGHFRESLRLDPTSEDARLGYVQALKARRPGFRYVLRYLLWTSRHGQSFTFAFVVFAVALKQFALIAASAGSATLWVVLPLLAIMVILTVLSWLGDPLFTAVIARIDRSVAQSLSPRQRAAANWSVAFVAVVVAAAAVLAVSRSFLLAGQVLCASLVVLPITVALSYPPGTARRRLAVVAAALALAGGLFFSLGFFAGRGDERAVGMTLSGTAYIAGCLLSVRVADAVANR